MTAEEIVSPFVQTMQSMWANLVMQFTDFFPNLVWAIVLIVLGFLIGFIMVSCMPVGLTYAAEITYPTPEGTSNGLVQLFGQAAVVFVYVMEAMRTANGSFSPSLILAVGLLVLSILLITQMKDPTSIKQQ